MGPCFMELGGSAEWSWLSTLCKAPNNSSVGESSVGKSYQKSYQNHWFSPTKAIIQETSSCV